MAKVDMDLIVEGAIVGLAGEGVWRILSERVRVLKHAGEYGLEHDDQHDRGELRDAAKAYIDAAMFAEVNPGKKMPNFGPWPWRDDGSWNPSGDPVRNLEKAGQLVAAEIDRLKRKEERGG